jgi:CRISPR-associated protein Cmr4
MTSNERTYWLHAVSPLHVGAGRGVGYIDLPIAREKGTGWPYVPGSAVKGVIADHYNANEVKRLGDPMIRAAFGLSGNDPDASSGSLAFSDASLVCLPVRSFYGTFAWIVSPLSLRRLRHGGPGISDITEAKDVFVAEDSCLARNSKVYLEDLDLEARTSAEFQERGDFLARTLFADADDREIFRRRFAVVHDDIFTFLCETGTQVDARIRVDKSSKTVEGGALWYEESLPADTILAGTVWCDKVFQKEGDRKGEKEVKPDDLLNRFCVSIALQIGGKATIGRGQARCVFSGGGQ